MSRLAMGSGPGEDIRSSVRAFAHRAFTGSCPVPGLASVLVCPLPTSRASLCCPEGA